MYNNQIEGVYIISVLDDRRETNDGNYPVKIRVTFKRVRKYYSTGKYFTLLEWKYLTDEKNISDKEKKELVVFLKQQRKDINCIKADIRATFDKIETEVKSLIKEGVFTFDDLNRHLGKSKSDSVNIAFTSKIDELNNTGQLGSKLIYQVALNSLEKYKGSNISFKSINPEWLKQYEQQLISEDKTYTTIGFYLRCMRHILQRAIKSGILKQNQYPFGKKDEGKYQIQTGESRKLALSKDQIKQVVNYSDGLETTIHYKSLWYFSLLCNGANFADILRLKYSDISNGEITFLRQKTLRTSKVKKNIVATYTPVMKDIIKKFGNPVKSPNNYVFPYLNGHETALEERSKVQNIIRLTNRKLSKIGKVLGIEGLNTYSARHSYTNILLKGGAPVALIADQLGHANIKTTQGYLAGFDKDERKKYSDLFSDL